MKKLKFILAVLVISCLLSSCEDYNAIVGAPSSAVSTPTILPTPTVKPTPEPTPMPTPEPTPGQTPFEEFSLAAIPVYSGNPYVEVNHNVPYFMESDLTTDSFEFYSKLDELGRCGAAYANICIDTMPTEECGEIGQVKPTGWHTVKYENIDGKYLYNRCHLIGFQLAAENANVENLITGTRYLNVNGMLPFENMVADYVKETQHHVLYRVTPIFDGHNLLANGVLMEARSVEDNDILFNVFCYNVQPGITINYANGDSILTENEIKEEIAAKSQSNTQSEGKNRDSEALQKNNSETTQSDKKTGNYILNTNTKKFHYPSCHSVNQMSEKNKKLYSGSRDDIIAMGYIACKRCWS